MNLAFVYITNPTKKEAKKIASHLLKKKLIACVNIFPINSIYRWRGRIMDEKEFAIIAKTTNANFNKVRNEVEKIHPYKIPCIVKMPVAANKKFHKWVKNEIKV